MSPVDTCLPTEFTCELVLKCLDFFLLAQWYYCNNPSPAKFVLYSTGFVVAIAVLILVLSLVISNYMFVNLHQITDSVHVSPKFLYFIIIPLINSLGDITNYYNGLKMSSELVLGQLIGSNLIICGFVIGLISIIKPISIRNDKLVLIDVIWLFMTFTIFNLILNDGKITRFESVVMVVVYLMHLVYLFGANKRTEEELLPLNMDEELENLERQDEENNIPEPIWLRLLHWCVHCINSLMNILIPLDCPSNLNYYYSVIGAILLYVRVSTFPVAISALSIAFIVGLVQLKFQLPYIGNCLGIINSVLIVSNISVLLLWLVKNFGLILKISDYLLGFLIFSIMNSINDIITNVSLSIKYNSLVGLNSCLGTPLLLILVGIGYNSLLLNKTLTFDLNTNLLVASRGLMVLMAFMIIAVPLSNWKFTRVIGFIALGFWLCISILNCILE